MSDVEGDVPSAAPVEATGPMGINEAIQEVLKQVRAQPSLFLTKRKKYLRELNIIVYCC